MSFNEQTFRGKYVTTGLSASFEKADREEALQEAKNKAIQRGINSTHLPDLELRVISYTILDECSGEKRKYSGRSLGDDCYPEGRELFESIFYSVIIVNHRNIGTLNK